MAKDDLMKTMITPGQRKWLETAKDKLRESYGTTFERASFKEVLQHVRGIQKQVSDPKYKKLAKRVFSAPVGEMGWLRSRMKKINKTVQELWNTLPQ